MRKQDRSQQLYLVALGSNRWSARHGHPRATVRATMDALQQLGTVRCVSSIIETPPLGPSRRRFANAAVLLASGQLPTKLLAQLKGIEARFGRRSGRRWGERVLDLDIILWSGGIFTDRGISVPHGAFRTRAFVLCPAVQIVPEWRDPVTGLSIRHLFTRVSRPKPLDRTARSL